MDNKIRDKFLTEAMCGCWHERKDFSDDGYGTYSCKHCNETKNFAYSNLNPNFSTWEGFGKLFNFSKKQDWWKSFIKDLGAWCHISSPTVLTISLNFIDPDNFADAIYEFLLK